MADDSVSATRVINAPAEAIFAVLADPASHAAIDGTGWVRETLDSKPLTAPGRFSASPCTTRTTQRATTRWPTGSRCSTLRAPSPGSQEMRLATVP